MFFSLVYLIVPPAVWIAVTNEFTLGAVLLGLGAGTWVAGFDIIYAIQDMSSDRRNKVHSIPADFGLAWGLFAGVGSLFLLVFNGVVMGLVAAHTTLSGSGYRAPVCATGLGLALRRCDHDVIPGAGSVRRHVGRHVWH